MQEIDPFADLGEEDPFSSQVQKRKNAEKSAEDAIEAEINQAQVEGNTDKVTLLKKIKQFYVLKHTADSEREKEGIDLMINRIRKQIAELEANQEHNQVNYQASVDNDDFRVENADYEEEQNHVDLYEDNNNYEYEQYLQSKDQHRQSRKPQGIRETSPYAMQSNNSRSPNRVTRTSLNEVEKRLDSERSETLEDKQNRGIKEIFDFYTRQHLMVGKKATFEQIEYELSNINIGEFMKFCKDFNIPLSKIKCTEVFKKTAKNSKDMFLEDFKSSLPKLLIMKKKEEQEELEKRLKEVKKLILKRKRKLEVNEVVPEVLKSVSRKSQVRLSETKTEQNIAAINPIEDDGSPRLETQTSEKIDPVKQTFKSKGGDPYGALQKIENEQLEKLRKEQAESRQNANVRRLILIII